MGHLVNGQWEQIDVTQGEKNSKGEFLRKPMSFRNWISNGGPFQPESDRYHLYVSYACPWAHRALLMRALKGLQDHISVDVVSPIMLDDGWSFQKDHDDIPNDSLFNKKFLRDVYTTADSKFTGKVTVPVLWDKKENTIVNNESSEIIRIFNSSFNSITKNDKDFYPEKHQSEIEIWNEKIYPNINNGVYRCGFAQSQEAYEEAFVCLFKTLEELDQRFKNNKYLVGESITEADIRLFPTLIRFDSVYHTHFKCNGKLIREYKNINRFVDDFMALDGIKETINLDHVKKHYYFSHTSINPMQIVPLGPVD